MNPLESIFGPNTTAIVERLGWVLLHSLWQFLLIAILAYIVVRPMKLASASARYGVLVCSLAICALCPIATWFLQHVESASVAKESMSVVPWSTPSDTGQFPRVASDVASQVVNAQTSSMDVPPAIRDPHIEIAIAPSNPSPWWSKFQIGLRPWLAWIVAFWVIGVTLFAVRPLLSWIAIRRIRRVGTLPVSQELTELMRRVSKKLAVTRTTELLQSTLVQVPLVVGYVRPMILLPVCLISNLPLAQLEAILAHELAHVRRHDFLVNFIQTIIETLFFYHPAIWWLSHRTRVERENGCDDLVIQVLGNRVEYGRALVAVEQLRSDNGVLALGVADGSMLARIRRITGQRGIVGSSSRWPLMNVLASSLAIAAVAGLLGWHGFAQSVREPERESDPEDPIAELHFGDELELKLTREDAHQGKWYFIDLEKGQLKSPPFVVDIDASRVPYIVNRPQEPELNEWLTREGVDLILRSNIYRPLPKGEIERNDIQVRSVRTLLKDHPNRPQQNEDKSWNWTTTPEEVLGIFGRKDDQVHAVGFIPNSFGEDIRPDHPIQRSFRTASNLLGLFRLEQPSSTNDGLILRIVHVKNDDMILDDLRFGPDDYVSGLESLDRSIFDNSNKDPYSVRFPNDVRVEFVGLSRGAGDITGADKWWRPDGSALEKAPVHRGAGGVLKEGEDSNEFPDVRTVIHIHGISDYRAVTATSAMEIAESMKDESGGLYVAHHGYADARERFRTFEVGVATEALSPKRRFDRNGRHMASLPDSPVDPIAEDIIIEKVGPETWGKGASTRDGMTDPLRPGDQKLGSETGTTQVTLRFPLAWRKIDLRLFAIDKSGKSHAVDMTIAFDPNEENAEYKRLAQVISVDYSEVDHFEYQFRVYRHWAIFEKVSLWKGTKTEFVVASETIPVTPMARNESNAENPIDQPQQGTTTSIDKDNLKVFGLDLNKYPVTTDERTLKDIAYESPVGSGEYRTFEDICFLPLNGPCIHYRPTKKLFFVTLPNKANNTLIWYGPIQGDPFEMLRLEPWLLESMKDFMTSGNPGIAIRWMVRNQDVDLASRGLKLMQQMLSDQETLQSVRTLGPSAMQAEMNLDNVIEVLRDNKERLLAAKVVGIEELEKGVRIMEEAFADAMPESKPEAYNEAGYLQSKMPAEKSIQWGPINNGMRLGLAIDGPIVLREGAKPVPIRIFVQNAGNQQSRFHVDGYICEWLRLEAKDVNGKLLQVEFAGILTDIPSFPIAWRLERGEMLELGEYRLIAASPESTVNDTQVRGMRSMLNRLRAESGNYKSELVLPLNTRRTIRAKGEWNGSLRSEVLSIVVQTRKVDEAALGNRQTPESQPIPAPDETSQKGPQATNVPVEEKVLAILRTPFKEDPLGGTWQSGAHDSEVLWKLSEVPQRMDAIRSLFKVVDRTERSTMDERRLAMQFLSGADPANLVPRLIKEIEVAIKNPSKPFTPYHEIEMLGRMGDHAYAARPVLVKLLDSSDGLAYSMAVDALIKIGARSPDVMNELAKHTDDPLTVYQLGRYGSIAKPLGPLFVKLLDSPSKEIRTWAAQALIKSGFDEARGFNVLLADVAAGKSEHRSLAATALAALGSQATSIIPSLRPFENDSDVLVSKAVREAIGRIEKDDRIFTHAEEATKREASLDAAANRNPQISFQLRILGGEEKTPLSGIEIMATKGYGESQKKFGPFTTDASGMTQCKLPQGSYTVHLQSKTEYPFLPYEKYWSGLAPPGMIGLQLRVTGTGVEKWLGGERRESGFEPAKSSDELTRITFTLLKPIELVLRAVDVETGRGLPGAYFYLESAVAEDWAHPIDGANLGTSQYRDGVNKFDSTEYQTNAEGYFRRFISESYLRRPGDSPWGPKYGVWKAPEGYEADPGSEVDIDIPSSGSIAEHIFKFRRQK